MRFVPAVLSLLLLIGCGSEEQLYISEPAQDRSIMLPPGLSATAKGLKNVFRAAGWKTFVTGTSAQTTGSVGPYVNVNTKAKYPARYSALTNWRSVDICLNLSYKIAYDISIVDNVTGEEVAALNGSKCEKQIEGTIKDTLEPFL